MDHVYYGIPLGEHQNLFKDVANHLRDFVAEGRVSITASAYARTKQGPVTYRPQSHKSSFVNSCLLYARNAGDQWVYVGDIGESLYFDLKRHATIAEAMIACLAHINKSHMEVCSLNLRSWSAIPASNNKTLNRLKRNASLLELFPHETRRHGSVEKYGKTIHNPQRSLKTETAHYGSL